MAETVCRFTCKRVNAAECNGASTRELSQAKPQYMKHSIVGRQKSRAKKHGYSRNEMKRIKDFDWAKVALAEGKDMCYALMLPVKWNLYCLSEIEWRRYLCCGAFNSAFRRSVTKALWVYEWMECSIMGTTWNVANAMNEGMKCAVGWRKVWCSLLLNVFLKILNLASKPLMVNQVLKYLNKENWI